MAERRQPESIHTDSGEREAVRPEYEALEDGSLDPDELTGEPECWDEGSDDET